MIQLFAFLAHESCGIGYDWHKEKEKSIEGIVLFFEYRTEKQQLWEKARIVQLKETKFQKRPCTEASSKTWPRGSWRNSALKRRAKSNNRICRTLDWKEFCHPQALWQLKHMEAITFVSSSNPFPISPLSWFLLEKHWRRHSLPQRSLPRALVLVTKCFRRRILWISKMYLRGTHDQSFGS